MVLKGPIYWEWGRVMLGSSVDKQSLNLMELQSHRQILQQEAPDLGMVSTLLWDLCRCLGMLYTIIP